MAGEPFGWSETHEGGHVVCAEAVGIPIVYSAHDHVVLNCGGARFTDMLVSYLGGLVATLKGFPEMPRWTHTAAARHDLAEVEQFLTRWPEEKRDEVMAEALQTAVTIVNEQWGRVLQVAEEIRSM